LDAVRLHRNGAQAEPGLRGPPYATLARRSASRRMGFIGAVLAPVGPSSRFSGSTYLGRDTWEAR
jgi:hypothetical protein